MWYKDHETYSDLVATQKTVKVASPKILRKETIKVSCWEAVVRYLDDGRVMIELDDPYVWEYFDSQDSEAIRKEIRRLIDANVDPGDCE